MRRILIILMELPFLAAAIAAPVGFKPAVDLTDSVSIGSPVWLDADGNGVTDATGYDTNSGAMVACLRMHPNAASSSRKILGGTIMEAKSGPFSADIDGDGRQDLVMQDRNRLLWWRSTPATGLVFMDVWVADLPAGSSVSEVLDLDGDGNTDILIAPFTDYNTPDLVTVDGKVAYSDGAGGFDWLNVAAPRFVSFFGRGCIDLDGDGDLDWAFSNDRAAIFEGREIARMQDLPKANGLLVAIDDDPGYEFLRLDGFEQWSTTSPEIRVLKLQPDGTWDRIDRFNPPDWWYLSSGTPLAVVPGNFDADASGELLLLSTGRSQLRVGWKEGRLIVEDGVDAPAGFQRFDSISKGDRRPDGGESLIIARTLDSRVDALGNPAFFGGGFLLRTEVSADGTTLSSPVMVTQFHDPRSFAIVKSQGAPRLASLGGADANLSVWAGIGGPQDRRIVSHFIMPGISLVAGKFRGVADNEVALLISEEDSARELTLDRKTSYLVAGRPYFNDGNNVGEYRSHRFSGSMPAALLGSGDFDRDGTDDLLYTRSGDGRMVWRSGNDPAAQGSVYRFGPTEKEVGQMPFVIGEYGIPKGAGHENVALRDLDQDGDLDFVQFPSIFGNLPAVYLNDGSGNFPSVRPVGAHTDEGAIGIFTGNFDGAGTPDLLRITNAGERTRIRIEHDAGTDISSETLVDAIIGRVVVADFNGDGLDDLAMGGGQTFDSLGNPFYDGRIRIVARKDGTEFHEPMILPATTYPASAMIAGDLTGDGLPDLIHGSRINGTISLIESVVAPVWPGFAAWATDHGIPETKTEDSDGDGASDYHEYLTGRNPKVAENPITTSGEPGEHPLLRISEERPYEWILRAHHPRPSNLAEGTAKVVLEHSVDLAAWKPVGMEPEIYQASGAPGWEVFKWQIRLNLPDLVEPGFYRIKTLVE